MKYLNLLNDYSDLQRLLNSLISNVGFGRNFDSEMTQADVQRIITLSRRAITRTQSVLNSTPPIAPANEQQRLQEIILGLTAIINYLDGIISDNRPRLMRIGTHNPNLRAMHINRFADEVVPAFLTAYSQLLKEASQGSLNEEVAERFKEIIIPCKKLKQFSDNFSNRDLRDTSLLAFIHGEVDTEKYHFVTQLRIAANSCKELEYHEEYKVLAEVLSSSIIRVIDCWSTLAPEAWRVRQADKDWTLVGDRYMAHIKNLDLNRLTHMFDALKHSLNSAVEAYALFSEKFPEQIKRGQKLLDADPYFSNKEVVDRTRQALNMPPVDWDARKRDS